MWSCLLISEIQTLLQLLYQTCLLIFGPGFPLYRLQSCRTGCPVYLSGVLQEPGDRRFGPNVFDGEYQAVHAISSFFSALPGEIASSMHHKFVYTHTAYFYTSVELHFAFSMVRFL